MTEDLTIESISITASSDNMRGKMINTTTDNCNPDTVTQTLTLNIALFCQCYRFLFFLFIHQSTRTRSLNHIRGQNKKITLAKLGIPPSHRQKTQC